MSEVILFASGSVDGYAAGPGDDLTRLDRWMSEPDDTSGTGRDDPFVAAFRAAGVVGFGPLAHPLELIPQPGRGITRMGFSVPR